jgi:hypothetical protein
VNRWFPGLFASGVLFASPQGNAPATQKSLDPKSMNIRQFQHLRDRAHTADDYAALAQWCRSRSEMYRKSEESCEAELRNYHSQSSPQSIAKHPTRGQTLKDLGRHYGELSRHWQDLAAEYSARAEQMQSGAPH